MQSSPRAEMEPDNIQESNASWQGTTTGSRAGNQTPQSTVYQRRAVEVNGGSRARFYLFDDLRPQPERTPQSGLLNTFAPGAQWAWEWSTYGPHLYLPPTTGHLHPVLHKDAMGRVASTSFTSAYPNFEKASLEPLVVQATDVICQSKDAAAAPRSYRRTYIRPQGAYAVRAAAWPFKRLSADHDTWTETSGIQLAVRWLPACIFAALTLPLARLETSARPRGMYREFPYRLWTYPWAARDRKENYLESRTSNADYAFPESERERILRPRFLAYLNKEQTAVEYIVDLEEAELPEDRLADPYVFVAWTGRQFDPESTDDMVALDAVGVAAAKAAGVPAFWVSSACHRAENMEEDVYRMSDVVRGARSLVIALGDREATQSTPGQWDQRSYRTLLREWGTRIWTLPEALLSPSHTIDVYVRIGRTSEFLTPQTISKSDFPLLAWDDALVTRQLMDHYLGNLVLSSMELVSVSLQSLLPTRRLTEDEQGGDRAYVLMGLLRRRPRPNRNDTPFQAFARLSLDNQTERLLERMICMQPIDDIESYGDKSWMVLDDVWGCSLWDIYPECQVAGIGKGDSIILDGCYAAAIKWDCFEPVPQITGFSWRRAVGRAWLRLCPLLFIAGVTLLAVGGGQPSLEAPGAVLLVLSITTILLYPFIIRGVHGGKVWYSQPDLFGFEGHLDIATIEVCIWGYSLGRLHWSVCGSSLSRHSSSGRMINGGYLERVGRDPTDDPDIRQLIDAADNGSSRKRIFTIVDTNTLQVTLIAAENPPVVALVGGKEGGMVRAILCSYDHNTNTVYREAVMRMESPVTKRMEKIGCVAFGLARPHQVNGHGEAEV